MNIESLGEGKIEMLFDAGLVHNVADLYDLTGDKLLGLSKIFAARETVREKRVLFQAKSVENVMKGLAGSRLVAFDRVLYALGLKYVGETVARRLARHFKSIDAIMQADAAQLVAVDEIGNRIAGSVIDYFANPVNRDIINRLRLHGLQFELIHTDEKLSDELQGMTIVVSGSFARFPKRDDLKGLIEKHGGKVAGSVTSKTSFIVAGEKMGPEKRAKAEALSIPVISEDEFFNKYPHLL
jgi:DNA ligase (NAD+)